MLTTTGKIVLAVILIAVLSASAAGAMEWYTQKIREGIITEMNADGYITEVEVGRYIICE